MLMFLLALVTRLAGHYFGDHILVIKKLVAELILDFCACHR